MTIKTKAIILSTIKYNDSDLIVKCFTRDTGFTTYFLKGLLKSKKGKLKPAFFQPNAILQLVATHKNKGQLEYVKEAEPTYHYKNIFINFDKLSISAFIREILLDSLKNEQPDEILFDFIEKSFINLDIEKFDTDFHIKFLLKLSKLLGFYPTENEEGTYFDMQNGIFSFNLPQGVFLNKNETKLLNTVLGTIFDGKKQINLSNIDRRKVLEILLNYYQLHIEGFNFPKSVKILNQVYQ